MTARQLFHHGRLATVRKFWLNCLALIAIAPRLWAQCQLPAPILDPTEPGQNGETRAQNFLTLVDSLYQSPATQTLPVGATVLQVPPWFSSTTDCAVGYLKTGFGLVGTASFTNYLVVSDELSELAIVTALANRDDRMLAIHHTIQAMQSSTYPGLPCWVATVSHGTLTCFTDHEPPPSNFPFQDTASDATARFGLAYFYAANNLSFPAASRVLYRAAGDALAAQHLKFEYATDRCFSSGVSGRTLCDWVAGGAHTASKGVGAMAMWIGYHPDIVRFLIAAYQSNGDMNYLQRAENVVDQWLMASTFSGGSLTVGYFNFLWDTNSDPLQPKADNPYYWDPNNPAWDDSDAPRALWMGDALRAIASSCGTVPATGPYSVLLDWTGKMQAVPRPNGLPLLPNESCIQFNHNGTAYGNCGNNYYYNGLGAGLYTYLNPGSLQPRLDEALTQFGWTTNGTWNNVNCFGIYRGIRPVKALATAIGLDASAYACPFLSQVSLTCPASPSVCIARDAQSATVAYPPPTVAQTCVMNLTPSCVPPSRSSFPVGSTPVTCSVTVGQTTASCSFTQVVAAIPDASITAPPTVKLGSSGNLASVPDAGAGAAYTWSITNGAITGGAGTHMITFTAGASGSVTLQVQVQSSAGCAAATSVVLPSAGISFYTLTPCRVVDTRGPASTDGGPPLQGGAQRTFVIAGLCGIPVDAMAVAINVTVVEPTAGGDLRLFPSAVTVPNASTLNFQPGTVLANNAVVGLSGSPVGTIEVQLDSPINSSTNFIIDVSGYFK
jgi:hypothetical protein